MLPNISRHAKARAVCDEIIECGLIPIDPGGRILLPGTAWLLLLLLQLLRSGKCNVRSTAVVVGWTSWPCDILLGLIFSRVTLDLHRDKRTRQLLAYLCSIGSTLVDTGRQQRSDGDHHEVQLKTLQPDFELHLQGFLPIDFVDG